MDKKKYMNKYNMAWFYFIILLKGQMGTELPGLHEKTIPEPRPIVSETIPLPKHNRSGPLNTVTSKVTGKALSTFLTAVLKSCSSFSS